MNVRVYRGEYENVRQETDRLGNVILTGQQADIKALEIAWEACGKPAGVMFHSDSNNAGVSLYHHSVCRLTRLV